MKIDDIAKTGMPIYEMQKVFQTEGNYQNMTFSLVTILPGHRIPPQGTGCHEENEYSIFLEGEVYTESGAFQGICKQGEATMIPKGEGHWCENRTDKPCKLACVLLK